MSNDTKNALTNFDLCLAIAQNALQSQIYRAWKVWKLKNKFTDKISEKTAYGSLEATWDTDYPVDISIEPGELGLLNLSFTIKNVSGAYGSNQTPYGSINSLSCFVDSGLLCNPVDLDWLAENDNDAHATVHDHIQGAGLNPDAFSIEYLTLHLKGLAGMVGHRVVDYGVPIAPEIEAAVAEGMNQLLFGGGDDKKTKFPFGTVVRRKSNGGNLPTFALTDFILNTTFNADPQSFNYLGMLAGRPLPMTQEAVYNGASDGLPNTWIDPATITGETGLVNGVIAIRKEVFLDNYLMPVFSQAMGESPESVGLTRRFDLRSVFGGFGSRDAQIQGCEFQGDLTITIQPSSNTLQITGGIVRYTFRDCVCACNPRWSEAGEYFGLRPL